MNARMPALMAVALVLMVTAASFLTHVGRHQTLSPPGVRTHPLTSSIRLEADLPEHVLDYQSKREETEDVVLATLPKDTSFGHRIYVAPDGFRVVLRVVLMGRDRTSMHKPQLCLTGQGWRIDDTASQETSLRVERPYPYELPVVKLVANNSVTQDGGSQPVAGVYVYWYVAHDAISASATGLQRMWLMASRLLRTGVLQRWAYVSCFAVCAPGQEAAAYDRMKQFIAAAVPDFQLYPAKPMANSLTAAQ
jgi:hypothetical protein